LGLSTPLMGSRAEIKWIRPVAGYRDQALGDASPGQPPSAVQATGRTATAGTTPKERCDFVHGVATKGNLMNPLKDLEVLLKNQKPLHKKRKKVLQKLESPAAPARRAAPAADAEGLLMCRKCNTKKAPRDFTVRSRSTTGWASYCHSCAGTMSKESAKRSPWRRKEYEQRRRALLLNTYTEPISDEFLEDLYSSPCAWCGSRMDICADHITPLARGGEHTERNLQPLCRTCNSSKGARNDPSPRYLTQRAGCP